MSEKYLFEVNEDGSTEEFLPDSLFKCPVCKLLILPSGCSDDCDAIRMMCPRCKAVREMGRVSE